MAESAGRYGRKERKMYGSPKTPTQRQALSEKKAKLNALAEQYSQKPAEPQPSKLAALLARFSGPARTKE